ncbi:MAG: hypothetical protein RBT70_04365 [Alphaproteobacteria bacterium]|jgi:hypothetical protein|nr:hypothetical protein [Alphaproteobacteria bacterium]
MEKTTPRSRQDRGTVPVQKIIVGAAAIPALRFFTDRTGSVIVNANSFAQAQAALGIPAPMPVRTVLYPINALNVTKVKEAITEGKATLYTNDEKKGLISAMTAPPPLAKLLERLIETGATDPCITPKMFEGCSMVRKIDGALIFTP